MSKLWRCRKLVWRCRKEKSVLIDFVMGFECLGHRPNPLRFPICVSLHVLGDEPPHVSCQ